MSERAISLLIVEDDPVFAHFVEQLLRVLGDELPCAPSCVDSAEKALDEIKRHPYELVLLDYHLPGASGLEVLEQIQTLPTERRPAVIMLTASGNETIAVEAMKLGAKDYLPKADLDVPPLTRALKSALAQKRLAEQVTRYNAEMQADLEMARKLQQSLLPDSYPCFPRSATPERSALRFCHRHFTTAQLGGDFFTVLRLSDTQAGVFICDVMGHGVRSALVTAMLRAMVDDLAPESDGPGHFLRELNRRLRALIKPTETPLFATAFYLIADAGRGTMRYANAGHPLPFHVQRSTGAVAPLKMTDGSGPALGFFEHPGFPTTECALARGDLVLLFTDGLFEVMSADGREEFGFARLLAAVRARAGLPTPQLFDELLAEVRKFSNGAEFADDVCLLGVEAAMAGAPAAKK